MDTRPFSPFRKAASIGIILAVSLTFLLPAPGNPTIRSSQAAFPGVNGKIAFAESGIGLKTINPDGSNEQSLLSGAISPAWSPDGKQLAYVAPHDSGSGIYIADADGSNPEYITIGADPAWSPDGKKLVYLGAATGLWVYDLTTHQETQLTHIDPNLVDYHGMPAWQPGGDMIVFLRIWYSELPFEHYDLWSVDADGSDLNQLTDVGIAADETDPGWDFDPSWSPDGDEILFTRKEADVGIYALVIANGFRRLLKPGPGLSPFPAWSPDGKKIAYISFNSAVEPDIYEIYTMDSEGKNDQIVFTQTVMIAQLDWGISTSENELVVNSDNNIPDNDPGDGVCDTGEDVPGGDPECTLLAAIQEANALPGKDTITFDIPGSGVPVIAAPDGFEVTDPVDIDGSTQPGGKVEIDGGFTKGMICGSTTDPDINGFMITAGHSTLRGFVIHGFCDWGIVLRGGNNIIEGNFIGTDVTGSQAMGNGGKWYPVFPGGYLGGGISIESDDNLIGGTDHTPGVCDGACNLISGNSLAGPQKGPFERYSVGIAIQYYAKGNTLYGNFVGTDITGQSLPSGGDQQGFGIEIYYGTENVIGGGTLGERNLISGNKVDGIIIHSADDGYPNPHNIIRGNFIGTDSTGAVGFDGGQVGVEVDNSQENQVLNNIIATKDSVSGGIVLSGESASNNIVQDNLIGTAADGVTPIGFYHGVLIISGPHDNNITNNTIAYGFRGINAALAGANQITNNTIHHNSYGIEVIGSTGLEITHNSIHHNQIGVWLSGEDTVCNRISANAIYANSPTNIDPPYHSGLGIDLAPEGPNTPNDTGDGDKGPNNLLNFPVLGFAVVSADGNLRVGGSYDGILGSHPYRIEFFANQACDESGFGEGEQSLGFVDVTTDFAGRTPIDVTQTQTQTQTGVGLGKFITAIAIDEQGNTSEFSKCVEAQPGDSLAAAASAGSTELQVVDPQNFRVGDFIRLNPGADNQEDSRVIGFGSLLLADPLQFAHAAGEPVVITSRLVYLPAILK
jgi:parallel beta-helix repeat protein